MKFRLIVLICMTCIVSACASSRPGTPADRPFDIQAYFDGRIYGYGIIERNNIIVSRFDMIVESSSESGQVILDETFLFDNGSDYRRVWRLDRQAPGVWIGRADNVKGLTRIEVIDGVVYMHYVASFPYQDDMISLRFNQQLLPMAGDILLNRSRLSKLGVPVGTVTVIFTKEDLEG